MKFNKIIAAFIIAATLAGITGCSFDSDKSDLSEPTSQNSEDTASLPTKTNEAGATSSAADTSKQSNTSDIQESSAPAVTASVSLQYAEDILSDSTEYDEFVADESEPQTKIAFTTDTEISDFKLLALTCDDISDDGEITFSVQECFRQDKLVPERPLVIGLTFIGDIPNYGFSYIDSDGTSRRFTIAMSGMDGSLIMQEF
ncbi:MAG: hypothetical protein ACI4KA_09005 [Oscillospiraceae bacterium]